MRRTETIRWIPVAEGLPDDDVTVLLDHPAFDEPVWLGYHQDGMWWTVDGNPLPEGIVKGWADMPSGMTI